MSLAGVFTSFAVKRTFYTSSISLGKHWNPKFKILRARKVIKIPLPDFDEMRQNAKLSVEEVRTKLKEKGIVPRRNWQEKPMYLSCTGAVIEPFVPPEGDGKISALSGSAIKERYNIMGKKGKSYMALRKIRNFEYDFDVPSMAEKALEIYIEAHDALSRKDEEKLHDLVTEKVFPEMMENVANKTLRWKFIQSLEQPRVVQVRCKDLVAKDNMFAQTTVRFYTQQTLAIYDRFGRLMHGSEDRVKDVLEYVVFEKHLASTYGNWRIHAKIIPDWMPQRSDIFKTFFKPQATDDDVESSISQTVSKDETREEPQPAAALT